MCFLQVMDRSQLPALTSTTMLVQAALSTPISARAKQSVRARNTVLVGGILTMVAANAAFALIPAVWGALPRLQTSFSRVSFLFKSVAKNLICRRIQHVEVAHHEEAL